MMISKTSQYALQAMIYLATLEPEVKVTGNDIARKLGLPPSYLSSIMPQLTGQGLAKSTPGPGGGFSLGRPASDINLLHILSITENSIFTQECLLGFKVCDPTTKCPVHDHWHPIKTSLITFLEKQTLELLGGAVKSGKYQIHELPYTQEIQAGDVPS
ncbi:MAG: Rrf2 family transcriptional regulator [Methylobacillus sp.]|jgi:Rrf2 family protein|nr:Rrf2 family transcriptional regulator [Methylobacillus sp.]